MTDWLRRAGRGLLPDGRTLLWSVAGGRRGRRWRSSTIDPGGRVVLALLYEEDVEGRFARLEMVTEGGMLTLHPELDGARVDGNVVTGSAVLPITLPWGSEFALLVEDSPLPEILTRRVMPTDRRGMSVVAIDADLTVHVETLDAGEGTAPAADDRGVPVLVSSSEWALEVEAEVRVER